MSNDGHSTLSRTKAVSIRQWPKLNRRTRGFECTPPTLSSPKREPLVYLLIFSSSTSSTISGLSRSCAVTGHRRARSYEQYCSHLVLYGSYHMIDRSLRVVLSDSNSHYLMKQRKLQTAPVVHILMSAFTSYPKCQLQTQCPYVQRLRTARQSMSSLADHGSRWLAKNQECQ